MDWTFEMQNNHCNWILKLLILLSTTFVLVACKSNHKPPKESDKSGDKLNIQIIVSPDVNPDMVGRPSPIRLDLYQLTSDEEFKQAEYAELIESPAEKLGDKLIQHDQYMMHPDTTKILKTKLDSHIKYLGVAAGYQNLYGSTWKLVLLKQDKRWYQLGKQYLYLKLEQNAVSQLSKSEMKEMLSDYKKRHPEQKNIKDNGRMKKESNDLSKGIFREEK